MVSKLVDSHGAIRAVPLRGQSTNTQRNDASERLALYVLY